MELDFTTEQRKFRDELRGYFAEMMTGALTTELTSGGEGGGPEFRKAMKQMGQDGLLGLSWPKEYGGQERPAIDQFIFADEVQKEITSAGDLAVMSNKVPAAGKDALQLLFVNVMVREDASIDRAGLGIYHREHFGH